MPVPVTDITVAEHEEPINISDYVQIGDYVNYNPIYTDVNKTQSVSSNLLTYISPTGSGDSHGNGYTSSEIGGGQTFTANSDIKWRVLSISSNKLELISENPIKKDNVSQNSGYFMLNGAVGYLYFEQELNEICKIYGYGYGADTSKSITYTTGGPKDTLSAGSIAGSGARSITAEDINLTASVNDENYTTLYSSYGSTAKPNYNVYYPTINTTSGVSSTVGLKKIKTEYYTYSKSRISNIDIQNLLFNGNYWLCSRCISTSNYAVNFGTRVIYGNNFVFQSLGSGGCPEGGGTWDGLSIGLYVRPIVTINSNAIDVSNITQNNGVNVYSLK